MIKSASCLWNRMYFAISNAAIDRDGTSPIRPRTERCAFGCHPIKVDTGTGNVIPKSGITIRRMLCMQCIVSVRDNCTEQSKEVTRSEKYPTQGCPQEQSHHPPSRDVWPMHNLELQCLITRNCFSSYRELIGVWTRCQTISNLGWAVIFKLERCHEIYEVAKIYAVARV